MGFSNSRPLHYHTAPLLLLPRPIQYLPNQIWDVRQPRASLSLAAHQYEVLAADWCKYNDCIIATGSVDKSIKVGGEGWGWGVVG